MNEPNNRIESEMTMDTDDHFVPRRKFLPVPVRMVRCLYAEPDPPNDPDELEAWCAEGKSARPIQSHVGDTGVVLKVYPDESICIEFSDGDQRVLLPEEIERLPTPGIVIRISEGCR